jgi:5'-3' exonuclease
MMDRLGLTCIQAPGEGEAMCAALCHAGLVDAVVTGDAEAYMHVRDRKGKDRACSLCSLC